MAVGVEVTVADGFATIVFRDTTLRGPGLRRLLDVGGPATVEKLTVPGPAYRVPEGNAREAGLLDEPPAPTPPTPPVVPVAGGEIASPASTVKAVERPRRPRKPATE